MSVKITIIENGPAIIQNGTESVVTLNEELIGNKIALCRCGKSSNGVHCDGSHSKKNIEPIPTPIELENIDWNAIKSLAKERYENALMSNLREDDDFTQYLFEEVMKTVYGKDYFKWENKRYR